MSNHLSNSDRATNARCECLCVLIKFTNGGWLPEYVSMALVRMRHRLATQCLLLVLVSNIVYFGKHAQAEKPPESKGDAEVVTQLEKVGAKLSRDEKGHVISLFLGSRTTNDTLSLLGKFPQLKQIEIHCAPNVTDEGLVHLAGLSELRILWFGYVGITDNGMIHLGKLSNLEVLHLRIAYKAEFNDAGLVHLNELKKLRELQLISTKVSDEAIKKLKTELPKCTISR